MTKARASALLFAALMAGGLSAPARASVYYDLTFDGSGGGTGTLSLNFATIAATENLGYQSIVPYFVDVSAINVEGTNFSITPSNLQDGAIQTSPTGSFYTLTVEQDEPAGDSTGGDTLFLDLYTGTWQIHGQYDSTIYSGDLTISGPYLGSPPGAAPLPSTWTLMLAGLVGIGFIAYRRNSKTAFALGAT